MLAFRCSSIIICIRSLWKINTRAGVSSAGEERLFKQHDLKCFHVKLFMLKLPPTDRSTCAYICMFICSYCAAVYERL